MNEVLSAFVETLLSAVIVAVVPAAVALVVAWLRVKQKELESKVPAEVLLYTETVADMVVKAAEQSGLAGYLSHVGMEKKVWAMEQGEALLKEHLGLVLDLNKLGDEFWDSVLAGLDAAIEARVHDLNAARG